MWSLFKAFEPKETENTYNPYRIGHPHLRPMSPTINLSHRGRSYFGGHPHPMNRFYATRYTSQPPRERPNTGYNSVTAKEVLPDFLWADKDKKPEVQVRYPVTMPIQYMRPQVSHYTIPERLYHSQSRPQHVVVNRNRFLANMRHAYVRPAKLETGYKEITLGDVLRRSLSPLIVEDKEKKPQPT